MAVIKRGNTWWYEFIFAGKRIRESAKTTSKTVAKEAEKNRRRALERSLAGMPIESAKDRIRTVIDVVRPYVDRYSINHRQKSVACCHERLAHVRRLLGNVLIPDLTEDVVLQYAKTRLAEGVSGRTVNMELQHLSAAIGKPWSILWPKVRKVRGTQGRRQSALTGRRKAPSGGSLSGGISKQVKGLWDDHPHSPTNGHALR